MNSTSIGLLILILSLCCAIALARFLIKIYYPQLTPTKCLSWVISGMRVGSDALKVILEKQPMETFLAKNWRSLLLLAGLICAIFVWPTRFSVWQSGNRIFRENRITGQVQTWDNFKGRWKNDQY